MTIFLKYQFKLSRGVKSGFDKVYHGIVIL